MPRIAPPCGQRRERQPVAPVAAVALRRLGAELHLRDADFAQERHRDGEVFAYDVVESASTHRHEQRLPLAPL